MVKLAQKDIQINKVPPQNIDAEQSIIGSVLLDNNALFKSLEIIRPEDFYNNAHKKIFSCILDLSERNEAIDLITLTEYLNKKGLLEEVGGASYLTMLVNNVPTTANIRNHSNIIREKSLLRNLISTATEVISLGYEDQKDIEELLDYAEKSIFAISERRIRPSFVSVKDIVKDTFKTIEKLYEKKERVTGVPTGFTELDNMTSGLHAGDLIIVAGRPSMGKTALALCMAQYNGIEKKETTAVFSLEMAREQLVLRMLCSESKIDAHKLRSGFISKSDWPKLTTAAGKLVEAKIYIDDTPAMSILEMRAKARRLQAEHGLSLIVVDYLQLMRGRGRTDSREQEISDISRSLKALAKELRVPVIALSQLSRAVESRSEKSKRPQLSDLRESGAIEQDADLVLFIYREEVYKPCECPKESPCGCGRRGVAEIIIGKQRNGPIGSVELTFLDKYTKFEDMAKGYD